MSKEKITFNPCFKKKYSTDKEGILNIRITENRKSTYFSLQEKIKHTAWDKRKGKLKETYEEFDRLSKLINDKIAELKVQHGVSQSVEIVKEQNKGSYMKYLLDEIDYLEKVKRIGTSKRYRTANYHLKKYLTSKGKADLLFNEIDTLFVRNYEAFFISQGIQNNTIKNYMNCIKRLYNQAVRQGLFIPTTNPFIFYVNRKEPVEKKRLSKLEFETLLRHTSSNPTLNYTKHFFLFQVFSQGLRVGDLMTLRFKNIIGGRLQFFQSKTKKSHTILVNDNMMMILKDYIKVDTSAPLKMLWKFKMDGVEYKMTYAGLRDKYNEIVKKSITGNLLNKGIPPEVVKWKARVDEIRFKIHGQLLIILHKYSKEHQDEFIIPILIPDHFKGVEFKGDTKLTKFQYNQISAKTALYNKNLKKLQKECKINTKLSSHISRHTYTDFMLMENIDVYDISKSLGHSKLSTTEHYLKEFSTDRVDNSNLKVNSNFSVL